MKNQVAINIISFFKNDWIINLNKGLKSVSKSAVSLSDKISMNAIKIDALSNVAWKLKNAAKGLFWSAIWEFQSFEQQMSKVKAITWANEEEFKKLTAIAKKMGATTAFTWKEAGDALEFLWMAWLSVKESMDALPWTLELAAAWNMELWEAADIATNIMAQFWIEAKNIWRVNDVLAKSATSANTSVQEMAEAMKYVWPVANSYWVSLEESAAAMNVLANNGIKAGMAGQSFAASLLRISKPTPAMTESIKALNLQLYDQNWKYVGITKTIKQLEAGTKNMTDEQKAQHIATVFWIQSTKQWLTLLKDWSPELEKYTKSLQNAWGTAKKMAKTQLDNLAWSFTLLKSAISWILIDIWGAMSKYLRPAIDSLTDFLSTFRERWDNLSPAMQNVLKIVWVIAWAFTWFLVVAWSIALILPIVTSAVSILSGAFALLTWPIWLVIWAIAALVLAYQTNFLGIQPIIDEFLAKMWEFFTWISEQFMEFINIFTWYWERMKEPIMAFWEIISPFVEGFLQVLVDFFTDTFNNIVVIISWAWDVIKWVFKVAIWVIWWIVEVFLNVFTGNWEWAWEAIKNMFSLVWEWIKDILSWIVKIIWWIISQYIDTWKAIFSWWWEFIKWVFKISLEFIKNLVLSIFAIIWKTIATVVNWIKSLMSVSWKDIKDSTSKTWESLSSWLSAIWNGMWDSATNIFTSMKESITWIFDDAVWYIMGLVDKIKWIWNWITGAEESAKNEYSKGKSKKSSMQSKGYKNKAFGGSVVAWTPYMVWERGREMFIPETNWRIIPNNQLGWNQISVTITWNNIWSEADEERLANKVIEKLNYQLQMNSSFGIS